MRRWLLLSLPVMVIKSAVRDMREEYPGGDVRVGARVCLYVWMTCPFCIAAKQLLTEKAVLFEEKVIDGDDAGYEEMRKRSGGGSTVPQIFINDAPIGGYTELRALELSGELDGLLFGRQAASGAKDKDD